MTSWRFTLDLSPQAAKARMDILPKLRLFVDAPLTSGAAVPVTAGQSHYLLHVMRVQTGGEIAAFNGRDGEWRATVRADKRSVGLTVTTSLRAQSVEPDLWLLFAPVKRARIDFIVEKATELGVSAFLPVWTQRTMASRVNGDRLSAIAVEAAEQCERLTVPQVREPRELEAVLSVWPSNRPLLLLDEGGGGQPIAEALAGLSAGPAALLVGPEGGFAKSELDALRALSFSVPVGLGPRILRADTAALAALACYQATCGDWRTSPVRGSVAPSI
jgi:16S rRNA (uracil1498-N3)-methyltransferase